MGTMKRIDIMTAFLGVMSFAEPDTFERCFWEPRDKVKSTRLSVRLHTTDLELQVMGSERVNPGRVRTAHEPFHRSEGSEDRSPCADGEGVGGDG